MATSTALRNEARGGFEAAIQGLATSIGPLLLFPAVFGHISLEAGFWAVLITATAVHGFNLAMRGQWAIIPSSRVASLAAYAALVLQLAHMPTTHTQVNSTLTIEQLRMALAASSLMFLMASVMVLISGILKLGNLFKMIPTPVTSGISNGTALLLVWLAIKQACASGLAAAATGATMLAVYLLWPRLQTKLSRLKLVPSVVAAILLGLVFTAATNSFVTPTSTGDIASAPWRWISLLLWPELLQNNWGQMMVIAVPGAITLAVVMILEAFTAAGVMETRFGVRVDANRELVVLGGTNMLSASLGGVPCTGSPIRSIASWINGGRTIWASIFCLAFASLAIAVLGSALLALPVGIIAGLFLIQANMLTDPVFVSRGKALLRSLVSTRNENMDMGFWLAFLISMVAFFGNLIWACFMGIGLSCLLVLRRVSYNLTANWAYLDQYRSRRVRSQGESTNLSRLFHKVGVLRLTGHLFFGNSVRLTQLVDELHPDASAVVVDVSQVADADPTGLDAVFYVMRALADRSINVVVSGIRKTNSLELRRRLLNQIGLEIRIDLDRALEYCEDMVLLNATTISGPVLRVKLEQNDLLTDLAPEEVTSVLMLGELREVKKGAALFSKGNRSDGVWMLESGMVSILAQGEESASRLSTFGPGQFVGEMGFIDGKPRSATAHADTPVRALLLNQQAITAMMERHPNAALTITRNIARELSHRVRSSTAVLMDESTEESTMWANSSLSPLSRY